MKLKFGILYLFMVFFNHAFVQTISVAATPRGARVENVKIQSKALNQEREILIYTPEDYDARTNEYFNVIYVFDSQSREFFDYTSSIVSFLSGGDQSFIVVGISSPYNEKLDYSRRNDFLPNLESETYKKQAGTYYGNADNFSNYVESEVIPYINTKYRTLNQNIAVGHSLSASFILYSLVKKPNLFRNYFAISPNLAYDDDKLSKELTHFDYSKVKKSMFIYLSHADEDEAFLESWKPARESVYAFFKDTLKDKNITVETAAFPNNSHWGTFPPSLNHAFEYYFKNMQSKQASELGAEKHKVTIRLKVTDKDAVVYITGNQPNLGDWNPNKIEMKKTAELEREIVLELQSPAQFKFTNGSWDTELGIVGTDNNVMIKPEMKKLFEFEMVKN